MLDDILVNVPRALEDEPGFFQSLLLNSRDQEVVTSTEPVPNQPAGATEPVTEPTAYLEPVSRRWMGKPYLVPALSLPVDDWSTELVLTAMGMAAAGGAGVEVAESRTLAADPPNPWTMSTGLGLGAARGFVVAVHPYQPDNWADSLAPLRLRIGERWQVTLTPTESGAAGAFVAEADADQPGAWREGVPVVLIRGDWYNTTHRLWCQPLGDDEWLVRNFDHEDLGAVLTTKTPTAYQPTRTEAGLEDDGTGEQEPPPPVRLPWGNEPLTVVGFTRCWVVLSHVVFPATWQLASAAATDLGYLTGLAPTVDAGYHLPAVGLANGSYSATSSVTHDGLAFAPETPGGTFSWQLAVAGPEDQRIPEGSGERRFAHRLVTVDKLRIQWPLTVREGELVPVSLRSEPRVGLQSLAESRTDDDSTATLTLEVDGPRELLTPWLAPNARWQWTLDGEVRFDGLRDGLSSSVYRALDGAYYTRATVRLRNRWRQLDHALWRGSVPLDGMKRAAIYRACAERAPLAAGEIEVATDLVNDLPLPTTRPGDAPAFAPQVGTTLGQVLRDLRDGLGYWDRVRFVGTQFVVAPRTDQPVAVFYRRAQDVAGLPEEGESWGDWRDLPAVLIGGPGTDPVFTEQSADDSFINDLWVIGRDPDSPRERPRPLVAFMQDPSSWQDETAPLHVAERRTAVVQRPELTSQAAVDAWCRCLWRQFHRFVYQAALQAEFAPTVHPGDLALLHPGADPEASLCLVEIVGMQTALTKPAADDPVRYLSTYEVRLKNETWSTP